MNAESLRQAVAKAKAFEKIKEVDLSLARLARERAEDELRDYLIVNPETPKPQPTRKPYRSDVAVACRNCGRQTYWRTPKGIAKCHDKKGQARDCKPPETTRLSSKVVEKKLAELLR